MINILKCKLELDMRNKNLRTKHDRIREIITPITINRHFHGITINIKKQPKSQQKTIVILGMTFFPSNITSG